MMSSPPTSSKDLVAPGLSTRMQRRVSRTEFVRFEVGGCRPSSVSGFEVDASRASGICLDTEIKSKQSCRVF